MWTAVQLVRFRFAKLQNRTGRLDVVVIAWKDRLSEEKATDGEGLSQMWSVSSN
ncbi:MAG: hypothetical protein MJ117_03735 [Lachnospiraceae bacterium]|nr:hypothetical protein [Lachnospiraceae bacterium]